MVEHDNALFHEKQRFGRILRWLLIIDAQFMIAILVLLLLFSEREHTEPLTVALTIVIFFIPVTLAVLFWMIELETVVRPDGLYIRFYPLHRRFRKFAFDQIDSYQACVYKPLLEYGGWGIRRSFKNKTAYNVSGDRGLELALKNGRKVLIGSQKPDELAAAMDAACQK